MTVERFTLIFDLDETLIHVSNDGSNADAYIPVKLKDGRTFKVTIDLLKLGIHVRPFMKDILTRFKPTCELVVWTAGHPEYANLVIDFIDPDKTLFDIRLFRDQCYISPKGLYIKDLRMINRDLDKCIIVDNALYSFGFQLENGVLILPFLGEVNDSELLLLGEYLAHLMKTEDLRKFNARHFRYAELSKAEDLRSVKSLLFNL